MDWKLHVESLITLKLLKKNVHFLFNNLPPQIYSLNKLCKYVIVLNRFILYSLFGIDKYKYTKQINKHV